MPPQPFPQSSDRESLLSEIGTLSAPAADKKSLEAWNALVASERARLLPRASLVREAKRLVDTHSIDTGRCPLCGQKVDHKVLARKIESALEDVMEASRDLERFRDPVSELADALEAAEDKRLSIHTRARAVALELPAPPRLSKGLQDRVDALAAVDIEPIMTYLSEVRDWDRAASKVARKAAPPEPDARDTQLAMLGALCQQVSAWQMAETKAARARRAVDLAERSSRPIKQAEGQSGRAVDEISHRVAEIYSALHPGEDLDAVSVEPWTAKGVELAIEFYGSRQRPPHGVLSESHLNSLAIALFLAMAEASTSNSAS